MGPLPNGLNGLEIGVTNHLLTDDPPSMDVFPFPKRHFKFF